MSQSSVSSEPTIQTASDDQGAAFAKIFSWSKKKQVLSVHRDNGSIGNEDPHLVITTMLDGYMLASTRLSVRKSEEEDSTFKELGPSARSERHAILLKTMAAFLDHFSINDAKMYVDLLASTLQKHAPGLGRLREVRDAMAEFGFGSPRSDDRFVRIISDAGKDMLLIAQNEEIPGHNASDMSLACMDVIHGAVQKRYTFSSRGERDLVLSKDAALAPMMASVLALSLSIKPTVVPEAQNPTIESDTAVLSSASASPSNSPSSPLPRMKR